MFIMRQYNTRKTKDGAAPEGTVILTKLAAPAKMYNKHFNRK